MAGFEYFDLKLVAPPFESELTNLIIELDYLRKKPLSGTTPPFIFFQLKHIFHMLESLASARIEGNITTVADYIETKIENSAGDSDALMEIQNMENCLEFIDKHIGNNNIDRAFISELHKMIVKDLPMPPAGEGDPTPGAYRSINVKIKGSNLILPDPISIRPYMDELFKFIATIDQPKYDLLKVAIAHHRFVWIHPFNNGNGRTVRLFTYAMLVKYGFRVNEGHILNPAAVFCNERQAYYHNLSLADTGIESNVLIWCNYVLKGLKVEIEKIDRLLEYDFLKNKILIPAIDYAFDRKFITDIESKILKKAIEKQELKAADITNIVTSKYGTGRSRVIQRLIDKKMLAPLTEGGRKYIIIFQNNYLLRVVIKLLNDEGFVSAQ
jgi:Fic family protein